MRLDAACLLYAGCEGVSKCLTTGYSVGICRREGMFVLMRGSALQY